MKAIGEIEGGADTVLDAWMEYFQEGLLVLPTHTWATMSEEHQVYDPIEEPSCVGILTNLFRHREHVVRSLHPTHSVAAYGQDANQFVQGEEARNTPCAPGGCYDQIRLRHGKILLVGVNHSRNTYIHCVEELLEIPERFTPEPATFYIKQGNTSIPTKVHRHYNPTTDHISEAYTKLEQAFFERGAATKVQFGQAECVLCDAVKVYEITKEILSHQPNCLMEMQVIPEEWWKKVEK